MAGFKISVKKEKRRWTHITGIVAVYLPLLSLTNVYFSSFMISINFYKMALILIPLVAFGYFMVYIPKYRAARFIFFFAALALALVVNRRILRNGFDTIAYSYTRMNSQIGDKDNITQIVGNNEFLVVIFIVLIVFSMIFSAVLLTKRMWILPLVIMLLPVFLISCVGYLPAVIDICHLIMAGTFYIVYYHENDGGEALAALTGAMIFLVTMMAVSMAFVPKIYRYKNHNQEKYLEVRKSLQKIDQMDLEKIISGMVERRGNYTKGGVGKGDLRNLASCKSAGSEELEVTLSHKPGSPIYLKAFVGTTYTGEKWEELGADALAELNKFAGSKKRQRQLLNTPFQKIEDISNTSAEYEGNYSFITKKIKIHVLNRYDDIGYFPYFAKITSDEGINQNSYIDGEGRKDYLYSYYASDQAESLMAAYMSGFYDMSDNGLSEEEKDIYVSKTELWKKYSQFVSEAYTDYPDELSNLTELCDQIGNMYSFSSADLAEKINAKFEERLSYTLNPGAKPEDKDFVEYFIESGKGFCVHFASTATLIYRRFGYPARYVEGYAIPESEFKIQQDGTYKAVVKDDMAHAWCEVFDQNMGWMVREHTLSDNNTNTSGQSQTAKSNQRETTTSQPVTRTNNTTYEVTTASKNIENKSEKQSGSGGGQGSSNSQSVSGGGIKIKLRDVLYLFVYVILFFIVLMVFCVIQCGVRINHKIRKFKKKKDNAGIKYIYNEIFEICCFCGLKTENKTEEQLLEQMKTEFQELSVEEWQWIHDCALRAAFSGREADRAERKSMYKLMVKFKKKIWKGLNLRKKVVFKFVKAM